MSCIVQQHRHDINCTIKPYPQFHNNAKPMEKRWTVVNDYVTEIWIHIHCASLTCSCCVSAKRLWVATAAAEIKCQRQSTKRCRRCNILADGPMQYLQTPSVEWRGETDNRATTPVGYCPSTAFFSVRPHCKNARRDRCQEYHNCFPFWELEETTRTYSNYVDEDYPTRPEIKQSLPRWSDNCGSESSTLVTDVCVWRYAP